MWFTFPSFTDHLNVNTPFCCCQNTAVGRAVVTPDLRSGEHDSLSLSELLASPFAILHLGWPAFPACFWRAHLIWPFNCCTTFQISAPGLAPPWATDPLMEASARQSPRMAHGNLTAACPKQWMLLSDELGLRESKVPITKGLIRRCLFNPGVVTENRST